jgi:hypothetical protein
MKLGIAWTLVLALALGACSIQQQQQQMRTARDNALGLFGFNRKPPATVRAPDPKPAAPAAPEMAKEEDEPVPVAAPRAPVETERVSPPPGGRTGRKS